MPYTDSGSVVSSENYYLGRVDYNLSSSDSFFGRYVSDRSRLTNPFGGSPVLPDWPEVDTSANQYFTLQERHIISANAVNEIRLNYTRTYEAASTSTAPNPVLQFFAGFPDGTISAGCPGCGPLGANTALTLRHRRKTDLAAVMTLFGRTELIPLRSAWKLPGCSPISRPRSCLVVLGDLVPKRASFSVPRRASLEPIRDMPIPTATSARSTTLLILKTTGKSRQRLTINLGVRYDYATNPNGGPLTTIVNPPFPDTRNYFTDAAGVAYGNGFTPVSHVFASNPNAGNFDPRLGLAYDPFGDHKTSIRVGFGFYHDQIFPALYASAYYLAPPYASALLFFPPPAFPNPFPGYVSGGPTGPVTEFAGVDYQASSAPYQMQYNLNIQRQITPNTVFSIGYIGSQGRHLFTEVDKNPPLCANSPADEAAGLFTSNCSNPATSIFANAATAAQNPKTPAPLNPASAAPYFGSLNTATPGMNSNYNSLQTSLNHQFSRAFQGQIAYTYSKCLTDGSVSSGLQQGIFEQADPYNRKYDYGLCSFDIRHNLTGNVLYNLPLHQNRLVSGWQIATILTARSGLPVTIQEGGDVAGLGAIQGDRPNYSGTCPSGRDQVLGKWYDWFNSSCYAVQTYGTLGNVPRGSVGGPNLFELDASIIKDTKLWERLNTEFRAEFFNVLNHTNFGLPSSYGVTTGLPFASTIAPSGLPGQSGAIKPRPQLSAKFSSL